jgi:hypothetical protein
MSPLLDHDINNLRIAAAMSVSFLEGLSPAAIRTTSLPCHHCEVIQPDPGAEQSEVDIRPYASTEVNSIYDYLSLLFPTEIASRILESASIWSCERSSLSSETRRPIEFHGKIMPIIFTDGIQGAVERPLRRIVVETVSKDQGWSSYPADHGTHRNSWTWFYITLERQKSENSTEWEEVARRELWPNLHASKSMIRHVIDIDGSEDIVQSARRGDRLCLWGGAKFPGWRMCIQDCFIWVFTATHSEVR